MRRCLVTGGTGFVGSRLVRRLVSMQVETIVLVSRGSSMWRIEDVREDVQLVRAPLPEVAAVQVVHDVDVIFHLAAAGTNQEDRDLHAVLETNVKGTLSTMDLARRVGARVVAAGSMLEYGPGLGHREDEPLAPVNEYAASKAAAWLLARAYALRHDISLAWLRLASVYGPAQTPSFVIPYAIVQAMQNREILLSNGAAARDFVYVDDVVDAFLAAARTDGASRHAFNVCSGRLVTVKEMIEALQLEVGRPLRTRFGMYNDRAAGVDTCSADPSKAQKLLAWEPRTSLREGLAATVRWYREHQLLWQQALAGGVYRSLQAEKRSRTP